MTRINERMLVQRVDEQIVVLDESSGAEVTFPVTDVPKVIQALEYLGITR